MAEDAAVGGQVSAPVTSLATAPLRKPVVPASPLAGGPPLDMLSGPARSVVHSMDYTAGPSPIAPWDSPDPRQTTGENFLPAWQRAITSPPESSPAPPVTALPGSPNIPTPPRMRAMGPDEPWPTSPEPYTPIQPNLDAILSTGVKGCAAGGTCAAIAGAAVPPIDPLAVASGCIVGGSVGLVGQTIDPWLENTLHDAVGDDGR